MNCNYNSTMHIIFMDIEQLQHVAKPARPIQELDGRIILFTKSK